MNKNNNDNLLTFDGHLNVFRKMLFRVIFVTLVISVVVFCFKEFTWNLLFAPSEWNFITYRLIENVVQIFGYDFHFDSFQVDLISTELSSQFMIHITTSIYLGLLGASPYILYELFKFISPALYENEKKHSVKVVLIIYALFVLGVLMSYFILFPVSFRFLGTYSVSDKIHTTITVDSYISTFTTLTFMMGIIFQLPIIAFFFSRMGIISYEILAKYRRHAFLIIMIIAAIITPPDIMTLILVTVPLYLLYEISVRIVRFIER